MKIKSEIIEIINDLVSVSDARAHLRIEDTSEDAEISVCVDSAFSYVENMLGYMIAPRRYSMEITDYTAGEEIPLPGYSVQIDAAETAAGDPAEFTLHYGVLSFPADGDYNIQLTAAPRPLTDRRHIIQALLMLTAKFFEQRGDDTKADTEGGWDTVDRLLNLVRRVSL